MQLIIWKAYGPYFEQLDKPVDTRYPSPHGEGCVLPDVVCMVNSEDEIRYYTPYNNFCLADFKEGENEIVLKLLRRTDQMKFAFGLRQYTGEHWHRSKWHTDLN